MCFGEEILEDSDEEEVRGAEILVAEALGAGELRGKRNENRK